MKNEFDGIDNTTLAHITGGAGRGQAIWNGVKRAYQAGRPILKESAEVAKDVGVIGGVAYGAKKAWDSLRGNPQPQRQGQE